MKSIINAAALFLFVLNLTSCNSDDAKSAEENAPTDEEQQYEPQPMKTGYTDFLEEILLGFEISGIHKHMVQTPFVFLGETDMLLNFSAQDENKVDHFVTFHKIFDEPTRLSAIDYRMDFLEGNSQLVMQYQQNLIRQLDLVYGEWSEDFETGYNEKGLYEAEWIFEGGVLRVTVGIDFIEVLLREH